MNIYIPIEIKLRELEGRVLLGAVAAERGHTVILGGKEDTLALAKSGKLPPGIVHHKGIAPTPSTIKDLNDLNKYNHLVTCQDEEHGLLEETFTRFAKKRFSHQTLSKTALFFCWGSYDQECLQEMYKEHRNKIIASGSPRVDYWREDFSSYYDQSNISYFKDNRSLTPYILIASNVGTFLNENRFWNVIATQRKLAFFEEKPGEEFLWYDKYAYQVQLIKEFVKAVRMLSTTFQDLKIVIRPHPIESLDAWEKLIGDFPNVVISREGMLGKWVRNATVLIHNGCTSSFEAAACKVPRIAYRPIPSEHERDIPNRLSYQAFSREDLINAVSSVLKGNSLSGFKEIEKTAKMIMDYRFANLHGKLAADVIVDKWEEIGGTIESQTASVNQLSSLYRKRRLKVGAINIASGLAEKTAIKKLRQKGFVTAHKFQTMEIWELRQILDNLKRSKNRFHKVRYKRTGRRSFLLYAE